MLWLLRAVAISCLQLSFVAGGGLDGRVPLSSASSVGAWPSRLTAGCRPGSPPWRTLILGGPRCTPPPTQMAPGPGGFAASTLQNLMQAPSVLLAPVPHL